jgi:peptidyl-prolyl cis-trans isomerase C/foldase protein PrsA
MVVKKSIVMVMVLCLAVFVLGCNANKTDKSIAEVNGEKITQADFNALYAVLRADYETSQGTKLDESKDKAVIDQIKTNTYDNLVLQKLIRQDAEKNGIKLDTKEVDEYLNYIKESRNSTDKEGYKKFLEETKFTEKGLREYLETQQLNSKLADKVTARISAGEKEANQYYDKNKAEFKDPGGIQIYHILVKDEKTARGIIDKLNNGGDFSALAKEFSIDTSNKDQGGDLGLVNEDTQFVTEFKTAALALQPGEYTKEPVKSQYGYHIIKSGDKKEPRQKTFEEVKATVIAQLENKQKDQAYKEYMEKLKKNADIKDLR